MPILAAWVGQLCSICYDLVKIKLHVVNAGLSDDDLRETAYEVLLVSVGAAG